MGADPYHKSLLSIDEKCMVRSPQFAPRPQSTMLRAHDSTVDVRLLETNELELASLQTLETAI